MSTHVRPSIYKLTNFPSFPVPKDKISRSDQSSKFFNIYGTNYLIGGYIWMKNKLLWNFDYKGPIICELNDSWLKSVLDMNCLENKIIL